MPTVEVWEIPLTASDEAVRECRSVLDGTELSRFDRYPTADLRRRFAVSHAATRVILGGRLAVAPAALRYQMSDWGKPSVPEVQHNLTHSGELAMLAISPDLPVGIDVEQRRSTARVQGLADRFFLPDEAQFLAAQPEFARLDWFLRLWTRKEAVGKASGLQLDQALKTPVGIGPGCEQVAPGSGSTGARRTVRAIGCPDGYIGAVAVIGEVDFEVVRRHWIPEVPLQAEPLGAEAA